MLYGEIGGEAMPVKLVVGTSSFFSICIGPPECNSISHIVASFISAALHSVNSSSQVLCKKYSLLRTNRHASFNSCSGNYYQSTKEGEFGSVFSQFCCHSRS